MNVDTAQNSVHLDSLFTGNFLGHKSDIADGSLRGFEFRKFENIQGDYYISPRFLSAVTVRCLPDTHTFLPDLRPRDITRAHSIPDTELQRKMITVPKM